MKEETVATIVAEIELRYKPTIPISSRPILKSSKEVYELFFALWDKEKIEFIEQFKVMLLNRANRVLGICTLTSGTSHSAIADPRQLFAVALKANACAIVLAHNHPSGNIFPSDADRALTMRMRDAGRLLEITVLDHIIVTIEGYYSFADEGEI